MQNCRIVSIAPSALPPYRDFQTGDQVAPPARPAAPRPTAREAGPHYYYYYYYYCYCYCYCYYYYYNYCYYYYYYYYYYYCYCYYYYYYYYCAARVMTDDTNS